MSDYDLGQYKDDYNLIYKLKKNYNDNDKEFDSLYKIYVAEKKDGDVFLKIIDKEALQEEEDYDFLYEQILKEKKISNYCNSDYTLKLIRYYETGKNIVFEKEYFDMDLKEYLDQNTPLEKSLLGKNNLQKFKEIAIGMAKALKFIHEKGVVHRNIKPHNVYINGKNQVKIDDFSCAVYKNQIKDSISMGTILYTAPEIVKNFDYDEKCDIWSTGLTLFEIYFGLLPYGWNPTTKKMNDMIYDEKKFIFRKSNIPTLDILFKRLLQINPENRMSTSEFYEYVTNENFLTQDTIAINNEMKYLELYQEICSEDQIDYGDGTVKEKLNEDEQDKQNVEKILGLIEEGNLPDLMSFSIRNINDEEKCNNIIYFDNNEKKYKENVYQDSDKFEKLTPGAFILCTNIESLTIIKDEIIKYRKNSKKTIFNIISNGRGYESCLKKFIKENNDFREFINKLCIYCMKPANYIKYKNEDPQFICEVTNKGFDVIDFINNYSSKEIKPFPLTRLVTIEDYKHAYKERHKKIAQFYGDLTKDSYIKNKKKIDEVISEDEKSHLLKAKKDKLMEGLLKFDLKEDLKNLDELIIKEYTKNTYYGDLNRWLMKGKMKYYEPVAYFTSRLMYSLNLYADKYKKYCKENKKILHRGAKLFLSCLLPYKRAEGKTILLSGFTSTSESENVAKTWAGRGRQQELFKNSLRFSVEFFITINHHDDWISNGINIQDESKFQDEKEVLFQPFSFYKVIKVNLDEKNYTADIYLETVGKKEILEEKLKLGKEIYYNENENIMQSSS